MSSQFNDSEDDTPLYTRRANTEDYAVSDSRANEIAEPRHAEREVTLNTGIVLGLFFALALLCAVFFGFGYSIGHKPASTPVVAEADTTPTDTTAATPVNAKPSPGSPASQPVPEYVPAPGTDRSTIKAAAAPASPGESRANVAGGTSAEPSAARSAPVARTAATIATLPAGPSVPIASASAAPGTGTSYVQIAAVSHQEDADVLLSALRRRGYAVVTRSEPADKLIHVQVGPFSSRKEADAMRQKLAGDGYNAFIK